MMNVGNPDRAFDFAGIPHKGVGPGAPGIHHQPHDRRASARAAGIRQAERRTQGQIRKQIAGYADPVSFYVDKLAEGIAQIAAAFAPEPVIVRLSDFKSNEYANLIGGKHYEPHEENPMLGFAAPRATSTKTFRPCFELECRALKRVRDEMGLTNVQIMVPFVRTLTEAKGRHRLLAANGLKRGDNGLKVIMMCELPTNALLAEEYLEYFDGMSIGSNDMTQLTLGLDRDSGVVAKLFDERDRPSRP
jgi:pyruvate,water dikinase